MCAGLDAEVEAFRRQPLGETAFPQLWLDATYDKVRGTVAELLAEAEPHLLAHSTFPETHRRQIRARTRSSG